MIVLERLTPEALGKLVALYEHRVFTRAPSGRSILSIQWGANWKGPCQRIIPELESETEPKLTHDSSTNALIRATGTRRIDPHDGLHKPLLGMRVGIIF